MIFKTQRSRRQDLLLSRRKLISKTSLEKFPDPKILESISHRHSMKMYESRFFGKDFQPASSQIERNLSHSALRDRDFDDRSLLNSFIIKKESVFERAKSPVDVRVADFESKVPDAHGKTFKSEFEGKAEPENADFGKKPIGVLNFQANPVDTTKEKRPNLAEVTSNVKEINKCQIDDNTEVNIKISILNINHSQPVGDQKEIFSKEASPMKIIEQNPNTSKPKGQSGESELKGFDRIDLIEDFLVEELARDPVVQTVIPRLEHPVPNLPKRIPKIDIGSLEEKDILKIKQKVKMEEMEGVAPAQATPTSCPKPTKQLFETEHNEMLKMLKATDPETEAVREKCSPKEDVEEVIYAIRTNIETIVEYSDLLIKIISEEFLEEVLGRANRFQADRATFDSLMQREYQPEGWSREFLSSLQLDPLYVQEVCNNLNRSPPAKSKNSSHVLHERRFKENQQHPQENTDKKNHFLDSDFQSTKIHETSNLSKIQLKTISNIDNFATIRSFSNCKSHDKSLNQAQSVDPGRYKYANVWDFPAKPYCLLGKKIFLRLTDKILSSYAEANIQENLFDIQKIFHRSIFDAFNESLSEYVFRTKMYSIFMEEIFILKKPGFDLDDLNFFLAKAKFIVIEKASEMVGFLVNKEDSELGRPRAAANLKRITQTTCPRTPST